MSPPEPLRAGHFCCSLSELLRRGTILRGGTVPPLKLLRGGTVPYSPPCIRSCVYILPTFEAAHVGGHKAGVDMVHDNMYITHL